MKKVLSALWLFVRICLGRKDDNFQRSWLSRSDRLTVISSQSA